MSDSFKWEVSPEQAFIPGFATYLGQIETEIHKIALEYKPQIETWMIQNAKWRDWTGHARAGLHADVDLLVLGAVITLDHGMTYGYFLENSNQGVWGIIRPALDYWAPIIWAEVQKRFSK